MEQVKLTDICNPRQWKTIPASDLMDSGFPVYGANGVIGYYSEYNHESPVVAITCRGATCGTINITVPKAYITGNAMCLDDVRSDIDLKYLYYCLLHYDFSKVISGSAQPQITRQGLEKVNLRIGAPNEQQTVITVLDHIKNIIDARQHQLRTLDTLIKARFVEMFGEHGSQVPLSDFVWFQEGPGVRSVDFTNEGVILLTGSNINDNEITFGHKSDRFISRALADGRYAHFMCDIDDILVVSSAIDPEKFDKKVTIVREDKKYCLNTGIIRFKPDRKVMTLSYFREFLKTDYFKHQVMEEMRGIAQMHFGPSHLKKMTILLPDSLEQQRLFEDFVSQVDKSKSVVKKALDEAQLLFDSLMQQYFG